MCLVPIKIRIRESKEFAARRKKFLKRPKKNLYLGRRYYAVAECKHGVVVKYVYDRDDVKSNAPWWYQGITNRETKGRMIAPPQILTDYVYKKCGEDVSEEEFHLPWRKCLAEHAYGV